MAAKTIAIFPAYVVVIAWALQGFSIHSSSTSSKSAINVHKPYYFTTVDLELKRQQLL
jgi:hypothetical protein